MSIQTETDKAFKNLREARKAILGRGGEISPTAGLKDLPNAIYSIPVDTSLSFQEDSSVAYRKIVPSNAEKYALVTKIGGLSYKCNNLITFPYTDGDVGSSKIVQGITYTVLEGGGIKVNGATGESNYASFTLNSTDNAIELIDGRTYIVGDIPSGFGMVITYYDANNEIKYCGSGNKIVWNSSYTFRNIYVQVIPNQTLDTIIYPMINEGETALPYEPYFKGLRDTKVERLESRGANLIPFPYKTVFQNNSQIGVPIVMNGVTFTVNADGSVYASGEASARIYFHLCEKDFGGSNLVGMSTSATANGFTVKDCTYDANNKIAMIIIESGAIVDKIYYPMINYGTESASYKPYKADALDTFLIPEEIFNREDWGRGANENYHNSIEYIDGRWYYIPRTKRKVFDGTETTWNPYAPTEWAENNANGKYCYLYGFGANHDRLLDWQTSICNMFKNVNGVFNVNDRACAIGNYCDHPTVANCYFVTSIPTLTEWKAHLAELYASGNPLMLDYAVANPEPIDITDLITRSKFLRIEGGGSITAHNEYEYDAPSTIKYTVKVG